MIMEDMKNAIAALGAAAESFLSSETFTRSDAPLIVIAEQMLQMEKGWMMQINRAKPKTADVAAPEMPQIVTEEQEF